MGECWNGYAVRALTLRPEGRSFTAQVDKLAEQYHTTVEKVRDIFGNKIGDWQNDSSYQEWYAGLEKFLSSKHPDWNTFSLSEFTFEYESDFTTTNIDQIIDDVLAGIIEYDTSLNQ